VTLMTDEQAIGDFDATAFSVEERDRILEDGIKRMLWALGANTGDQHFIGTPHRVGRWLAEFRVPEEPIESVLGTTFEEPYKELVLVKNVPFVALCAHHLLPFIGTAHLGYIPDGKVVGLSKLPRALHYHAHRMTLQEKITYDLAEDLMRVLKPLGVMVILESEHQCMAIRGVKAHGASMITSAVRGVFLDPEKSARSEMLSLIHGGGRT
jgi:GTP cyclohydrolase I